MSSHKPLLQPAVSLLFVSACGWCLAGLAFIHPAESRASELKDFSGTWVAKQPTPMGEMETVFYLKTDGQNLSGSVSGPFGDSPITDGRIAGDKFEFVVLMDFFGQERRMTNSGSIVGDELHIRSQGPGRPRGGPPRDRSGAPDPSFGPGGPPPGEGGPPPGEGGPLPGDGGPPPGFGGPPPGEGGPPPGESGPPPGAGGFGPPPGFGSREMVARRGTPSRTRPKPVDYRNLPKIELPDVKDLAYNGMAPTPPMGWNSWNKFQTRISDPIIRATADAIVESGMREAGYVYLNLDDGWQGERDTNGVLQPNTNFPNIKELADYVHSKGLKLGIYSSPGPRTCAGYEGSYGHEELDAKTWGDWGIDYLKYDWCSAARVFTNATQMRPAYQKMAEALRATGRPMVYSICQYGREKVWEWGPKAGGNLWRTTGDIQDRWQSMARIGFGQDTLADYAGPGHWNDPDMLEIGNGGMTPDEYRVHFSLWALLAAPLIAGNDLRNMSAETKEILLNKEVIAVDQDPLGKQGRRLKRTGAQEIVVRPLADGSVAAGLFNLTNEPAEMTLKWSDLSLTGAQKARDLWAHADLDCDAESLTRNVPAHGVLLIRVTKVP